MKHVGFKTLENKQSVKNGVGRLTFTGLAIIFEVASIVLIVTRVNEHAEWISYTTRIFALLLVLGIYSQYKTSSMKTPWIVLILMFPVAGTTLYLMVGLSGSTKRMARRYQAIDKQLGLLKPDDRSLLREARDAHPQAATISNYLSSRAGFPLYTNTDISYYDEAAKGLEAQLDDLRKAKRFIFLEYHAIEHTEPWLRIENILAEKVKEGVEVRVIYDDVGSIGFITVNFIGHLKALGIHCRVFNPVIPVANLFLNNRDHRKITVIDGEVGYTGGYNIANEYFNITHPYGHWKDTGVRLQGDGVCSLTAIFLEMWNAVKHEENDVEHIEHYIHASSHQAKEPGAFIQPYADSPVDGELVGENVYISIINQARDFVWFITPYLILTDEMIHAMGLAAKRGVDVRIVTPGIPDKKLVYGVTRSYYHALARNGVRIYEYTPGFCHAKMCVADNLMATCGTINLDYRSLFHHFEDGCFFYNCKAVTEIRDDMIQVQGHSREVTRLYATGRKAGLRFGQLVLRMFAPLM